MIICSKCGKLLNQQFYYCPWCGISRINSESEESKELKLQQHKEELSDIRQNKLEEMEKQLNLLERELNLMVLSYEMSR